MYSETSIGSGRFFHGDCFNVMRDMPAGSVDMVVTSPPYDNLRTYNDGDAWTWSVFEGVAAQLARVLKPGGTVVWVVADETVKGSKTGSSFRQALHFKDVLGMNLHDTMIWNKGCFSAVGALQTRYAPVFEYMFVLTKGKIGSFNPIKDRPNKWAGTKIHGTVRNPDGSTKPVHAATEIPDFGQRFNIWDIFPQRKRGGHPAVFPEPLARDHILSWSNPGDVVLDPFGGSGTTAIAAENAGRQWICIERDPDYAEKALQRIRDHVGQPANVIQFRPRPATQPLRLEGANALLWFAIAV